MKKYNFNIKNKWSRRKARKAIPLFASFFLGQFALPAGNITDGTKMAIISPNPDALRFINFELDIYNLYEELGLQQAGLDLEVFNKAMVGYLNLSRQGVLSDKRILTIADFDKSSSEKRLWVININAKKILFQSLVAHGKNSGNEMAEQFSNTIESNMSSLGFYVTHDTYIGKHGLSLKLQGMDAASNANAAERHVVVHGADYVSEDFIKQNGRLGRSQGCPALPMDSHQEIIETIKGNTVFYLHASQPDYNSEYLDTTLAMETYYRNQNKI